MSQPLINSLRGGAGVYRRVRAHGRLDAWAPVFLAFWIAVTAGADQSDPAAPPADFGANRAQLIHELHNPCLKGRIVTCYTPGYRDRAVSLQQFLTGELDFVRQRLKISVTLGWPFWMNANGLWRNISCHMRCHRSTATHRLRWSPPIGRPPKTSIRRLRLREIRRFFGKSPVTG